MTYTMLYLEDQLDFAYETIDEIHYYDSNANIEHVRTISEAKQKLRQRSDIAFIIVDLLLVPESNGEGGHNFIEWVLTQEQLAELPIIVTTRYPVMMLNKLDKVIKNLEKSGHMHIQERIDIVHRTHDYDRWRIALLQRIDDARRKYSGS